MDKKTLFLIAGGILLIPFVSNAGNASNVANLSYLDMPGLPSGMKKNNPGNIVAGVGYQGEIPGSSYFARFQTWAYGIRAMIVLLTKYIERGSSYPNPCVTTPQNTVELIVKQWAPPYSCGGDNPEQAVQNYINHVSQRTGFSRNQILSANPATLRKLVKALSEFEQGRPCVTDSEFNYALTLV